MVTPMQSMPWKTLVRGLLKLSEHFLPTNYLLPTAISERCLKDHLHAVLHDVLPPPIRFDVDWETDIDWADVRDYALDARADLAAFKAGVVHQPIPPGGPSPVGGALPSGAQGPGGAPLGGAMPPGGPGPRPPVRPKDRIELMN